MKKTGKALLSRFIKCEFIFNYLDIYSVTQRKFIVDDRSYLSMRYFYMDTMLQSTT